MERSVSFKVVVSASRQVRNIAEREGDSVDISMLLSEHAPDLRIIENRSSDRAIVELEDQPRLSSIRTELGEYFIFSPLKMYQAY